MHASSQQQLFFNAKKGLCYSLFFLIFFISLSSCATKIPQTIPSPFAILGEGATSYVVLPIKANRALVDSIAKLILDPDSSSRSVLDRTDIVYAGLFDNSAVRVIARGNFPAAAAPVVFPASKGWKKNKSVSGKNWYQSSDLEATIPWNSMVLASSIGFIDGMLTRAIGTPSEINSPQIDPFFVSFADTAQINGTIGVCIPNAKPLVDLMLGGGIEFPIQYVLIFAQPSQDGLQYTISARIPLYDERSARSLSLLLKVATNIETSYEGSLLLLSGYSIATEKLAELALFFVR